MSSASWQWNEGNLTYRSGIKVWVALTFYPLGPTGLRIPGETIKVGVGVLGGGGILSLAKGAWVVVCSC